jgi:hypothetical protein
MNMKPLIVCSPLLLLCGCSALPSEHVETIQKVLADQVAKGNLTESQFESVMGALAGLAAGDWTSMLMEIFNGVITLAAGYLGVRFWRGPVTARKGLPPQAES